MREDKEAAGGREGSGGSSAHPRGAGPLLAGAGRSGRGAARALPSAEPGRGTREGGEKCDLKKKNIKKINQKKPQTKKKEVKNVNLDQFNNLVE